MSAWRGLRGSRIMKRSLMFYLRRMISDILSLQPGFLIKPADTEEYGQEKQSEHKVGSRTQKFIQVISHIEEKK
jgi:hypothetical protein